MAYNITRVAFGTSRRAKAEPIIYQHDVTQILVINGVRLPEYYVVDFCNEGSSNVIPITGTADGVEIPDELIATGKTIKAYIVIDGIQTRYEVKIPVNQRPPREDIDPDEGQQQAIDALVAALNSGVSRAETAAENAEGSATNAEKSAEDSEAWSVGERNGEAVDNTDETYQNNAKFYANVAQQGAEASGYAWFDVHDDDGCMYVYISDNLSEDVSFAVDEAAGILEVTYN